jgi:DNA-binding MarR family transcriptional regulator
MRAVKVPPIRRRSLPSSAMPTAKRRVSSAHTNALRCIRALVDVLYHSARSVESRTGLTNAQLTILRQVAGHGPLTVNEIAARVRAGQNGVSMVLSRLEEAGLVTRAPSKLDRRRVHVSATASGKRVLRRSPRPPTEQLLEAVDRLSPAEAREVARAIGSLLHHMGRGPKPEHMLFE